MSDVVKQSHARALRILLADDSSISREMLRPTLLDVLEKEGFPPAEVIEVADGREALDPLEHGAFDLMVLDYVLPVVNGEAVITAVRAGHHQPSLPIIVITCSPEAVEQKVIAAGASCFLFKPVTASRLASALHLTLA